MKRRYVVAGTLVIALGLSGIVDAQASIIYSNPNADLTSPFTINPGNGKASYTFTAQNTGFQNEPIRISTGGSGLVTSLFFGNVGGVNAFFGGQLINDSALGSFSAFPSATPVPTSSGDTFIGLKFSLNGETRFGYAEVFGYNLNPGAQFYSPTLVSYAYQSEPDVGIVTGAQPTAVPEPSGWAMFSLGLFGLLGFGVARRRALLK